MCVCKVDTYEWGVAVRNPDLLWLIVLKEAKHKDLLISVGDEWCPFSGFDCDQATFFNWHVVK